MATQRESTAVYAAGIIQGVALVTFPAAGTIFTSPDYYNLSTTAYGSMFLPQAIMAIVASFLGTGLTRRLGIKRVYLAGLIANLASMLLLFLSQFFMSNQPLAYGMLLLATTSLGIGFGLTVPSLNTYAAGFFPEKVDKAVLTLNALLGLGTALAPVFVAIFVGLGIWWGLPVLVAILLGGLLLISLGLPLQVETLEAANGEQGHSARPARFWLFASFALLYGIVETMNANWATLYMNSDLGASTALASLALTAFWAMVTAGRIFFALVEKRFPARRTFHLLPLVAAVALVLIALLPTGMPNLGVLVFGLAGLGCSALLPLTISFGQKELTVMATAVAGSLIAFYQMGYGLAAFGVGPILDNTSLDLNTIYGLTAIVALIMALLSYSVTGRKTKSQGVAGQ